MDAQIQCIRLRKVSNEGVHLGIFTRLTIELMPAKPRIRTYQPILFDQNVVYQVSSLPWPGLRLARNSWQGSWPLPTLIGPFVLNNYRLRIFHAPKVVITIVLRIITVISKIMAAPPHFNQRLDSKEPMSCQSCRYKKLISIKRSSPSIRFAHQILCLAAADRQMISWLSSIAVALQKHQSITLSLSTNNVSV